MSGLYLSTATSALLLALAVLVLLKESREGRVPLALGLLLLALVETFDRLATRGAVWFGDYKSLALLCQPLIPVVFLVYGMLFTKRVGRWSPFLTAAPFLAFAAALTLVSLLLPLDHFFSVPEGLAGGRLTLEVVGYWYYTSLMIFCVAALVNLEAVFSRIRGMDRWNIKYEFIGVGAILAVMIFIFSQALLYRAVDLELLPVRSWVLIVAAALIGYSRLFRGRTQGLAVSRQAVYRSFTLLAVGIYLLALGLLGEGMKRFNVEATRKLSLVVAIISGLVFLALLLSEEIRRRLKVFIAKNFYSHKHDYREEWLGFSNALATCRESGEVRLAIIDRYRRVFGLRFVALYAREGAGCTFALAAAQDRSGLASRVDLSPGLMGYFTETGRVMNPSDGEYTPTDEEARFLSENEAWLLVPQLTGERLEAFIVFGRQIVPERLTYEDFDLMKIIGRQAVLSLRNFQLLEELSEARELAAVAKVSSFVIHDLKNLAYTFSLMMENVDEHIGEPEFQRDLVKSIQNTVTKMNTLIAKLKGFPEKRELNAEAADLALIARETLEEISGLKRGVTIIADIAAAEALADVQEIRRVALNLLLNACDAVGAKGRVKVSTGRRGTEAFLRVEDNGCGMSPSFVQGHLFKPFRTTKEKGLGIGLYQCKQIIEAHGGRIEVDSREGEGTVFTVLVPLKEPPVPGDQRGSAQLAVPVAPTVSA